MIEDSIFKEVLKDGLSDKGTFEQRLKRGVSHVKTSGKMSVPSKKSRPCKSFKVGVLMEC